MARGDCSRAWDTSEILVMFSKVHLDFWFNRQIRSILLCMYSGLDIQLPCTAMGDQSQLSPNCEPGFWVSLENFLFLFGFWEPLAWICSPLVLPTLLPCCFPWVCISHLLSFAYFCPSSVKTVRRLEGPISASRWEFKYLAVLNSLLCLVQVLAFGKTHGVTFNTFLFIFFNIIVVIIPLMLAEVLAVLCFEGFLFGTGICNTWICYLQKYFV